MNKTKPSKKINKEILKGVLLVTLLVVSYFLSVLINGFKNTNIKLLNLLIFTVCGFVFFFIIYYIFYFISYIKLKHKKVNINVNCDSQVDDFIKQNNISFKYNSKKPIKENVINIKDKCIHIINLVLNKNQIKGKYNILNFTIYDGLNIYTNVIDFLYNKIDTFFTVFHYNDKPLSVVENKLNTMLKDEIKNEVAITEDKKPSIFNKAKNAIINAGITFGVSLLSNKINNLANEILYFITKESLITFSNKNNDKVGDKDE